MNLFDRFASAYAKDKARPVFLHEGISFHEIEKRSAQYANLIGELGIHTGDRVCICTEKCIEWLLLYLGCLRSGAIVQPLNPDFTQTEIRYYLNDARPLVIICKQSRYGELSEWASGDGIRTVLTLDADNSGSLVRQSQQCRDTFTTTTSQADDLAALLYSSGTTGKPKGIPISHGNLIANATALVAAWGMSADDVLLHALPLFHVHGLFIALGTALAAGSQIILLHKFTVDGVLQAMPDASVFMAVPTYYTRLLADVRFDKTCCQQIRLFTCGSAPLLAATFAEIAQRTGHQPLERYGMTEAAGVITSNALNGERRAGSVGQPLPGLSIKIIDDHNAPVRPGERGELVVKGSSIFSGYWQRPEATAAAFTEAGYFRTGDIARISEDGHIQIVGRCTELIISAGENIYPKEIEACLNNISGIIESAVIGIPHTDLGEQVCAIIVTEEGFTCTEEDLKAALKQRLARFKVPRTIHTIERLPRNAMGKVQKHILRRTYTA